LKKRLKLKKTGENEDTFCPYKSGNYPVPNDLYTHINSIS
jgi:hypothetical protein